MSNNDKTHENCTFYNGPHDVLGIGKTIQSLVGGTGCLTIIMAIALTCTGNWQTFFNWLFAK